MYCVRCKKNTANENTSVRKTKQSILMLYQIGLFVTGKGQGSLNIKNSNK